MARVIWSAQAADEFEEIVEYIALDKPDAATEFAKKVMAAIEGLEDFPMRGRLVPERPLKPYRELIVPPCRIIYLPAADRCEVTRIMRSEQRFRAETLP